MPTPISNGGSKSKWCHTVSNWLNLEPAKGGEVIGVVKIVNDYVIIIRFSNKYIQSRE